MDGYFLSTSSSKLISKKMIEERFEQWQAQGSSSLPDDSISVETEIITEN